MENRTKIENGTKLGKNWTNMKKFTKWKMGKFFGKLDKN